MKTTTPATADPEASTAALPEIEPLEPTVATASADPVVAEDVGHPVGVGIGALSAGAAGAAIGAVAGPIGILVGAVIGAVAGGLVGEEVATAGETAVTDNPDSSYTEPDLLQPTSLATGGSTLEENWTPTTSGSLFSGSDEDDRRPVDTTPDIPAIPAAEAELTKLEGASAQAESVEGKAYPEETIRTTAYYHYVERETAGLSGNAHEDWIAAEREVLTA